MSEHDAELREPQDRFVSVWGQMGSAWGISRTMAEVHALLFITGEPLCTDEIMDRLEISRGNASMSLRALTDWGVVTRTHKRGDRKEYFRAEQDVWAMFRVIVFTRLPLCRMRIAARAETVERSESDRNSAPRSTPRLLANGAAPS